VVHAAGAKIDVHLMIDRPERQVEAFAAAGADSITIHAEATPHLHYTLQAIEGRGCLTGLAINPGTPAEAVAELEPDMVLCMTVNPGWGGQRFLEHSLTKLVRLRELIGPTRRSRSTAGSTPKPRPAAPQRAPRCSSRGPPVFGAPDPAEAVKAISTAVTR
jgi:ribulose-phosphate 3-epimerase